ncbi:hypothetical protein TPA0909_47480 [Streptomyces albus]|nr:hypothetical protein TPA0909_47480 [Streptomyces albus]
MSAPSVPRDAGTALLRYCLLIVSTHGEIDWFPEEAQVSPLTVVARGPRPQLPVPPYSVAWIAGFLY